MTRGQRRASADRAVSRLVQMAQAAATDELSPHEQTGLLRLEATLARHGTAPRSHRRAWMWGFGAFGFGAVAAAIVLLFMARRSVQAFEVANGKVGSGGYIHAIAPDGARVRFADGSEVRLESATRTRVTEVSAHGARVLLEEGKANVQVMPLQGAKWLVEAGPYVIAVTGTAFDVAWSGPQEVLDLWLRKGSVIVTGPLTSRGLVMQAGQHLVARVRESQLLLDGQPSEDSRLPSADTLPDSVPVDPSSGIRATSGMSKGGHGVDGTHGPNAASTDEGRSLSWSKRLATGDVEGVLADADRRGIELVLSKGSRADIAALSDAARYGRRFDVARRALLAERERFGSSIEGKEAAFFLGGLAESDPSSIPSALEWYDRYLAENPHGVYSSQAAGRKMMVVHKLRGREAARALSLAYLKEYPTGPYARYARKLLDGNAVE